MIEPVDSRKSNCNKKHLTLEQRKKILEGIKGHYNQEMISKDVGVHKTTVSREILSHRKYVVNHRKSTNRCESVSECKISHIRKYEVFLFCICTLQEPAAQTIHVFFFAQPYLQS